MKKLKTAIGVTVVMAGLATTGFAVSGIVQNITAQLRPDYVINIDGELQMFENVNGEQIYPISYDGTTYLPVRAIGEIMGKDVFWNDDLKEIDLVPQGSNPSDYDGELDTESDNKDIELDESQVPVILVNSNDPDIHGIVYQNPKKTETNVIEITVISELETYNVTLKESTNATGIQTYNNVKSGTSVKFENLIIGNIYSFILSSNDAPMGALYTGKANASLIVH